MTAVRSILSIVPAVLFLLFGHPASVLAVSEIPGLVQVRMSAPQADVNVFLTGPFLEGVTEGNILYLVTNPAASTMIFPPSEIPLQIPSNELRRVGPFGPLPPMSITASHSEEVESIITADLQRSPPLGGRIDRLNETVITNILAIFSGNGMVYPYLRHDHLVLFKSVTFDGVETLSTLNVNDGNFFGNGPILNSPGGLLCEFPIEVMGANPWILSTNRLHVPDVLVGNHNFDQEVECSTTGYVLNGDLTLEITPNTQTGNAGESEGEFFYRFRRSDKPYDPVPPVVFRHADGFAVVDPNTGEAWGPYPFNREFYFARGGPTGAAVVWMGSNRPKCTRELELQVGEAGESSPDLEGPYFPPDPPDPHRVLELAGVAADAGTAQVVQTADRFVLLSWREGGVEQWGSFKYSIFGNVVSPCKMLGDHVKIEAKHVQDGIGAFFNLDDLEYPFSIPDKQNPDLTISVREDGSFSMPGVLAGTYELTFLFDDRPVGEPIRVNVTTYQPAVFELPSMLGSEKDQAYYSPASGLIVNLSNGNLMLVSTDIELSTVGPALGFTRVYNNLDVTQELNALRPPEEEAVPLPMGHGWTHNYNWMILKADSSVWDDDLRKCMKNPFVVLIDEDGTRHTFTVSPQAEKISAAGREALEFNQQEGTGADPMQLLMTEEKRFELVLKDGTKYIFDIVQGRNRLAQLTRVEDPNRNALILDYDPQGRLVQVESTSTARKLRFDYTPGADLISTITDPAGRTFRYEYSFDPDRPGSTAKLIKTTSPTDSPVEYAYTGEPSLIRMQQDCAVTTFLADPCRRVVDVTPPVGKTGFAYVPSNDVKISKTSIIDAKGVVTEVTFEPWTRFDTGGQPIGGGRVRDVTDAEGKVTRFGWDGKGNLVQRIEANGLVITTDYDQLKNIVRRQTNNGDAPVTWTYQTNLPDFDPRRSRPAAVQGRSPSPELFAYDAAGNSVKTEQGDIATTLERNPDGTESRIDDPDVGPTSSSYVRGNLSRLTTLTAATTFEYRARESLGLPDKRAGPDGTKVFEYNDAGRTTLTKNIGVELCKDQFADLQTSTAYDGLGNATRATSPCQTVEMEYSCANQLTKRKRRVTGLGLLEDQYFYDERGQRIKERLADGLEISYEFDLLRRTKSITRGVREPRKETFEYDAAGNVSIQSNGVEEKRLEYDLENRIKRSVRILPGLSALITDNVYNSLGLVSQEKITGAALSDPSLLRTSAYDNLNRISEVLTECGPHRFRRTYTYEPKTGRLIREDDGDYTTVYVYDPSGRVVEERRKNTVTQLEEVIQTEYNANDYVTKFNVVGCHPPTERRFNNLGWLLEEKRGRLAKTFCHDHCGRIVDQGDNLGNRVTREFNEEGWMLSETRNGRTTRFSHDAAGRIVKRIDPDGAVHEFIRNEHGDPVRENHLGVALTIGGPIQDLILERKFDSLGNMISQSRSGSDLEAFRYSGPYLMGKTDRARRAWDYTRDAFGNLTSISVNAALLMKYENDGCGNRLTATDANGRTTKYKHDSRGRVIEETRPDGTVITKKYHGSGKLVERVTRPPLGVVRVERWDWSGGEELVGMENSDVRVGFEMDENCLLRGISFSGAVNRGLTYTTDAENAVTGVGVLGGGGACASIRYIYDADKNLTKVIDGNARVTVMEYDGANREKKRILPNGEVVDREYNAAGWILKQTHTVGNKTFVREWQYDTPGRVVGYGENGSRFTYEFDTADRLTRAVNPDGTKFDYTYDTYGNAVRIASPGEIVTQTFDSAGQLLRREVVSFKKHAGRGHGNNADRDDEDNRGRGKGKEGAGPEDDDAEDDDEKVDGGKGKRRIFVYEHDANGRLTAVRRVTKKGKVKEDVLRLEWDGENRLSRAIRDGAVIDYSFDPDGRLIRRLQSRKGVVEDDRRYVWDVTSENILVELDGADRVLACYVPTRTQDDVILKENHVSNKTAIYSDFNRNLPTQIVRDEFGNVIETLQTPEPYGAMQTASSIDHTRFQGKMQDPVTGIYYFHHRWYDPQTRRFISPDPQPFDEFNPTHTANPYQAFANNPVQNTDPTGQQSLLTGVIVSTVVAGGIVGGIIADDFYFGKHEVKPGTEHYTKIEDARQEIQNVGLFDGNISWAYEHVKPFYFQRRRKFAATRRGSLALTEPVGNNRATIRTTIYENTFRKFGAPKQLAVILYHELIHGLPSDYYELNAWRGSAKIAKLLGYPAPIDKDWVKKNALSEGATIVDTDFD